jgi:hypothetical protein
VSIVVALHKSYSNVNHAILSILYEKPAEYEFSMGRDINIFTCYDLDLLTSFTISFSHNKL